MRTLTAILTLALLALAGYTLDVQAERNAYRDYSARAVVQAETHSLLVMACLVHLDHSRDTVEGFKVQTNRAWQYVNTIENRCPEASPPDTCFTVRGAQRFSRLPGRL